MNFNLKISVDAANWFAASPDAYMELSGAAGTPAALSIAKADATVTICWRTETVGQYQLQRTGALGGTT